MHELEQHSRIVQAYFGISLGFSFTVSGRYRRWVLMLPSWGVLPHGEHQGEL